MRPPTLKTSRHFQWILGFLFPIIFSACTYTDVEIKRDIVFGEVDGSTLKLDVYRKRGFLSEPTSGPALICVHGGGWKHGDKNDFFYIASELVHSRGVVCFSINYRLVTGNTNLHPAAFDDVQRAVRWVRANGKDYGVSDPSKIALFGGSAGAHLSLLAAMAKETRDKRTDALSSISSSVKCVIDLYGPTDLTEPWSGSSTPFTPEAFDLITNYLGVSYANQPASYSNASPYFQITAQSPPVLIFHGTKDALVPVGQSEKLFQRLKTFGVPAFYFPLEGEGHDIRQDANWQIFYKQIGIFFDAYL